MKNSLPLFICIILAATGCNRYQYLTINSNNNNLKQAGGESREFVIENDSLQITYNFQGENAPVHIRVMNKLDRPIAIDWKRSALIVNDKAISYMIDELKTTGTAVTNSVNWNRDFSTSFTTFSAVTPLPVDWQMIPPKSFIEKTPLGVTNAFVDSRDKNTFVSSKKVLPDGTELVVKEARFTEENSPLKFRSYLTVLTEGNGSISPVVFEHAFYASNITNSMVKPSDLALGRAYVKKTTAFGTGFGVVAGAAIVGTAAALTSMSEGK
ncbi:hypothetical protein [Pseudobacter ginsenosidimutans]|uniref:Uncharacterized protein n=1 Tax=Pseudobacter ginsenosidimutans TaxID=661488 RepID=A0A4Q7MKS9_9BACT|nr:hypothetical protein [Pseudobacter ginsenosidimutans]QEC45639.1 hypothetical protein FSB84_29590 [Pseudobacter ginsenosidimutans]RZS67189.1 hypothetical protein EV199_5575 [Pseudobacter ginsenosidimutans]